MDATGQATTMHVVGANQDPAMHWPDTGDIPDQAGCYTFWDANKRALYVGKARKLRRRLNDYRTGKLHGNMRDVLTHATSVTWICLPDETDALWAEANLIATLNPKYNLKLRSNPTPYPHITIGGGDWPRLTLQRNPRRGAGNRRWGPFPGHARELADALTATFGMRPCNDAKLHQHQRWQRPCLLGETGRCSAPCIDTTGYQDRVDATIAFLDGNTAHASDLLRRRMQDAADERNFEHAAQLRDRIITLENYQQQRNLSDIPGRVDVTAATGDDLGWLVLTYHLRDGILLGTTSFTLDNHPNVDTDPGGGPRDGQTADEQAIVTACAHQWQHPDHGLPDTLITGHATGELTALLNHAAAGRRRRARRPRTASEQQLYQAVVDSSASELTANRRRRLHDTPQRTSELQHTADLLGVPHLWRVECLDISHYNGTDTVAGLSVLIDGIPQRDWHSTVTLNDSNDDYASMHAAVTWRISWLTTDAPANGKHAHLCETPDLLLIDGGPGQVAAAQQALDDAGVHIPIAGLAKRLEELWLPGQNEPLIIPRDHAGLYLLQRARDSAHHVAITRQRRQRRRTLLKEGLDGIPGLGTARKARLERETGGLDALIGVDAATLKARHPWLPHTVCEAIAATLT